MEAAFMQKCAATVSDLKRLNKMHFVEVGSSYSIQFSVYDLKVKLFSNLKLHLMLAGKLSADSGETEFCSAI